ncbi:RsmB/NOP family class I SAM-dependent RNA methyltransferase [Chelativorans sp. YIM 93263]|uniref:RsmB/NOP family class I SAM-dependent RNA methyltransferase n=1 Tax=Chelativorans sp. YIM 93263 TaxID=2906648 RepID=UPI0023780972|nr:RsmB/NOP family class I SAM-dependent RNA methyltransferase [Chelativorans sp. YIM 93263]
MSATTDRRAQPARKKRASQQPSQESKAGLRARQTAVKLLSAVVDAHTPLDALTDGEHGHPHYLSLEVRDRALVRAILVSALRHRSTIDKLLSERLQRSLPANARSLSHILHVGAAQILFLDVPDSAAVDLAVTQAKADPRTVRFASLVNGVLRNLARGKADALPKALAGTRDAPQWLIERLEAAYGTELTDAILEAHRHEAPIDLTVKSEPEIWAKRLGGIVMPNGSVRLDRLDKPVPELAGYSEGAWWVQDAAASLPARLLGNVSGLKVADLCAAPGGKTAELAHAGAQVTAVDQSASRLKRLESNLARLGLEAEIIKADILNWPPEMLFDAVLLDAPCSSTGTIRRHPDVLWTKTPDDISRLAHLQKRLLERAFEQVKPGGTVVFANCSLVPEEGENLVAEVIAERNDVELDPVHPAELPGAEQFVTPQGFLRTLPVSNEERGRLNNVDGFFAARLKRAK